MSYQPHQSEDVTLKPVAGDVHSALPQAGRTSVESGDSVPQVKPSGHTPWRLDTSDGHRRILATNPDTGIEYALLFDDELGFHAPDNITLARIVQCVNAHDDLVELLKEVFAIGKRLVGDVYGYEFVEKARAVLSKATGDKQ